MHFPAPGKGNLATEKDCRGYAKAYSLHVMSNQATAVKFMGNAPANVIPPVGSHVVCKVANAHSRYTVRGEVLSRSEKYRSFEVRVSYPNNRFMSVIVPMSSIQGVAEYTE